MSTNNKELLFSSGDRYLGPLGSQGLFEGEGLYTFANGSTYKGCFKGGVYHGKGIFHDISSSIMYEGNFKEGTLEGKCKANYGEGVEYSGTILGNKRTGKGTLLIKEMNLKYEGEFLDDLFEGKGKIYINNKLCFEGFFHLGRLEGFGREIAQNYEYEGDFKFGQKHGKGTMRYLTTGDVYEGGFLNDCKDGLGVYRFSNGGSYEGEFHEDEFDGKGVLKFEGAEIRGRFVKGKLEGNGEVQRGDELMKGKWEQSEKNGVFQIEVEKRGRKGFYKAEFRKDVEVKRLSIQKI